MAGHFKQEDTKKRSRRPLVVGAVVGVLVVAAVGFIAWKVVFSPKELSVEVQEEPSSLVTDPPADVGAQEGASLPFSLSDVPTDAAVTEVSAQGDPAALSDEWTFGGDYVTIGSFPVDADTVFGSTTTTPDNSASYAASLIRRDGSATQLETPDLLGTLAWEPQDGSGNASRVVWRSSSMSFTPFSGADNWRVQAWSEETGSSVVLGTASDLNGTDETPMLDAEVVPTANAKNAFFASYRKEGENWVPSVLAYDLDAADQDATVLGEGCYPAATTEGALWAGDVASLDEALSYGTLYRWDGSESTPVFSVSSEGDTWSISGVWASDGYRAVSFSSSDATAGAYIGIWEGDFERCVAWLHAPAPRVIASMNDEWIVWGAGSELDNPGMFAFNFATGSTAYLGSAPGYSRPSIARDNNAVIVPECDGQNAAVFHVGVLG